MAAKVRIALVSRNFPPNSWCGIGRFYVTLASSLKARGHDVEVFCQGYTQEQTQLEEELLVTRVMPRKNVFGKAHGGDLGGNTDVGMYALALATGIYEAVRRRHRIAPFDVIEGHDHLGINALINIRFQEVATITRCHMSYQSLVVRGLVNWPHSRLMGDLERWSHHHAAYRIAPSSFMLEIAQKDFTGRPVDAVVPNELSSWWGSGSDETLAKEPLILFVGRMVPELKNPDRVARVFKQLSGSFGNWRLEFAGLDVQLNAKETMWSHCRDLLGADARVRYHGHLDEQRLRELYRKAKILVIPSVIESFGLVALEAMASGCVPVVADQTALPEVIGPAGAVFANGSDEDLYRTLTRLMSDETHWLALARETRGQVAKFQTDRVTDLNLLAYQRALDVALQRNSRK